MSEYQLADYASMLGNQERITAYHEAIRAAVRPGAVVLEIGTGTGCMALMACQQGASRVYAIEPADAIVVARQAARDNGFADRIVFHRARSTDVTLPERCDVLICDLRGSSSFYSTHLTDLMDARERLLKKDAIWICQTDTFYAAVCAAPNGRSQVESSWDGSRWGLNLNSALRYAYNNYSRQRFRPQDLLSASQPWGRIDYPNLVSPHVRGRIVLTVERPGVAQGFALWFEAALHGGFRFSNAPDKPASVYANQFVPWPKTVTLQTGDEIDLRIDVVLSGISYEWTWETTIRRSGQAQPLEKFRQSTFQGHLNDAEDFRRSSPEHRPAVTPTVQEQRFLLERIDGQTTQGELAAALRARFPDRFPNDDKALARVKNTVGGLGS